MRPQGILDRDLRTGERCDVPFDIVVAAGTEQLGGTGQPPLEIGADQRQLVLDRGLGELVHRDPESVFRRPTLAQAEEALERCLAMGVVTVDTWDLERFADCPSCGSARVARLERINLSGAFETPVSCSSCGGA